MQRRSIGDYAVIGDCRSAALISSEGGVDWLCWPRFDSAPLFGDLLDDGRGGTWRIAPREHATVKRAYVEGTNVLRTTFSTERGVLELTDFMPVMGEEEKFQRMLPDDDMIRIARCREGVVDVEMLFAPRPDLGRRKARLIDRGGLGIRMERGAKVATLMSEVAARVEGDAAHASFRLRQGEVARFSLSWFDRNPGILPRLGDEVDELLGASVHWWRRWSSQAHYSGRYKDAVVRSALALKLEQFAPSGAIVAAPTTSLPEQPGGSLNWDYRYCWVRDASFTTRALFGLGFVDEGHAFASWLLHATHHGRHARLRVLYDVYGRKAPHEEALYEPKGFLGSRPVRFGNLAQDQLQLDAYGEVVDSALEVTRRGGALDGDTARMLVSFGEWVCRHWERPDEGIWEPRHGRRHHTHSKAMCAVALRALLEMHDRGETKRLPRARFQMNHDMLIDLVEREGWSDELGSYVQTLGGDKVDAALLTLPIYDLFEPGSSRMRGTYERVKERLSPKPGLVYRYEQSLGEEGCFVICGFWMAELLAMGCGTLDEAVECFEGALSYANDVGLLSEEVDPSTGELLGNFPQGFSHVGLVNAALRIHEREKRESEGTSWRHVDMPRGHEEEGAQL